MNVVRDKALTFESSVQCLCVGGRFAYWTHENYLFAWRYSECSDDAEQQLEPMELPFVPATMCAHEDRVMLACSGSILFCHCDDSVIIDDDDDDDDENVAVTPALTLRLRVDDVSVPPAVTALFPLITHSCFSPCGSRVAVISQTNVLVVPSSSSSSSSDGGTAVIDCAKWFVGDACLCAFGASVLVIASRNNHVVSLTDADNFATLARDGQVIASSTTITSIAVDDRNGQVLFGMSDGVVRKHALDTLVAERVVQLGQEIARCLPPQPDSATIQPIVTSMALCGEFVVAATPVAVCVLPRTTLSVSSVVPFGGVAGAVVCGSTGCVLSWVPFTGTLQLIHLLAPISAAAAAAAAGSSSMGETDVVHATRPLPAKFLAPLESPTPPSSPLDFPSKPVTFHRKIKSSGYHAAQPWSVQQAAKVQAKKKAATAAAARVVGTASPAGPVNAYDMSFGPCTVEAVKANAVLQKTRVHSGAILAASFDATGNYLVTASSDTTAHMLKCPVARNCGDGICVRGHTSMVQAVDCSLHVHHPLVVTGSVDGTVAIWNPTKRETAFVRQSVGKEVKSVRFFYLDKLLACAVGGSAVVYRFLLDSGGGDLDRQRNDSKIAPVHTFATGAQQVTALECYNAFASNVLVWAGSNKQVGIYDVAQEAAIRVFDDAHKRTVHSIELARSSRFASSVGSPALHTFATAGMDKCVHLWDMRQQQCVRTLSSHVNSSVRTGVAFSPCARFLYVGSEDRAAYVYDVGAGAVVTKLPMGETVTAIRHHPLEPVVALCDSAGDIRLFTGAHR